MVDAAGISVTRLRYGAVLLAGVLCGIAGAYLTLAQNASFTPGMTAGRGFMALAAMVFGQWHPLRARRRLPAVRLSRRGGDPPAGRAAAGHRLGAGGADPGAAVCADRRAARGILRTRAGAAGAGDGLREGTMSWRRRAGLVAALVTPGANVLTGRTSIAAVGLLATLLSISRSRNASYPTPPPQIRTCGATAYGSCLGS